MPQRRRYTATYRREDGWWIVRIAEAQGVHSNGRTLQEAQRRVREALSLDIGDNAFNVEIVERVRLPRPVKTKLAKHRSARKRARTEAEKATMATRHAVRALTAMGLSVRDAGELLGLTGARVAQLLKNAS